jgi:hypothetical protein
VVTRTKQNNDTQRWIFLDFGGYFFTIQQVSSGRFLEATLDGDFQVVTRAAPDSNQTVWRLGTNIVHDRAADADTPQHPLWR